MALKALYEIGDCFITEFYEHIQIMTTSWFGRCFEIHMIHNFIYGHTLKCMVFKWPTGHDYSSMILETGEAICCVLRDS